ncbi:MAG TPA: PEP/pyruvate-binding domain-containing protein [Noviherbaspirillum sp.]|uniref:PEP/pyruvate-binding domain-containing protein n=1 Tax=Noviherbaspirillum sp. TaxID=1926288 RepID=UPI002B4A5656|nr:PEP/pyruvate-binding domain-containing protein [Noviherbaspirillum sp.]HJV84933.1 PEP/pyruvate-binding domain-containing protein [Noviherbaspirillum sp.]
MNAPLRTTPLLDWKTAVAGSQEAGGKGWQLGLLARYGLPVPDGFVIPATICRTVMDAAGITARLAGMADAQPDEALLARCRTDVAAHVFPEELKALLQYELERRGWNDLPLAVRSSATCEDSAQASFAGIHLSRLNVRGVDALIDAVRDVWASLWTPHAAVYRARFGIAARDAAMAVVVMPLLPAKAAGIAFSCDPRSGRDDQVILHAHWGLGEALVAGEADGDEYRLQEDLLDTRLAVIERRIGGKARRTVVRAEGGTDTVDTPAAERTQAVLTDAQALELGELVRDAAFALDFGRPFYDVEWVWDGARFWIVQARPVTAMARNTYPGIAGQPTIWSNGNTRDVMPLPQSALDWCSMRRLVNTILEQGYRCAGYPLLPGGQRAALHKGRLYLNLSMMMWEAWDGFGVTPKIINDMAGGHQPEITVPPAHFGDGLRRIPRLVRYVRNTLAIRRKAQQIADRAREHVDVWERAPLPDDFRTCRDLIFERSRTGRNQPELGLLQGASGASLTLLVEHLAKYLPGQAYTTATALLAGGEPSVTAQQSYELAALAELASSDDAVRAWLTDPQRDDHAWRAWDEAHPFRRRFHAFLDKYGHRAVYESYWRQPRWREAPGYLLDNIASLLDVDTAAMRARQQQAREEAWRKVRECLPWHARLRLKSLLADATRDCNQRELARSSLVVLTTGMRPLFLHVGRKLVEAGTLAQPEHVFELTLSEVGRALEGRIPANGIAARVADRLALREQWETDHAPDVIFEGGTAAHVGATQSQQGDADTWMGVAVGAGLARGIARVIHNPAEGTRLEKGDILVAPSTDPAWTPLFLKAGGLVMETGGYLSHGAIVAREFAVPAVVNLPGILRRVKDGDMLEVDGGTGRVRLLDR